MCRVALCSVSHGALSTESAPFYRMARFLGIPKKRSAFCRKRRFLKSAEHIYMYGTHQKECNQSVKFVHCVLIRNVSHFYALPLDLCGKRGIRYRGAFCQTCRNPAKHDAFSREKRRNPWIAALYETAHFQE